jgi:hypothetical protein
MANSLHAPSCFWHCHQRPVHRRKIKRLRIETAAYPLKLGIMLFVPRIADSLKEILNGALLWLYRTTAGACSVYPIVERYAPMRFTLFCR